MEYVMRSQVGTVIDRTSQSKGGSTGNRDRFMRRHRGEIKKRVIEASRTRGISQEGGVNISIPKDGINEPVFRPDRKTGDWDMVHPGNDKHVAGDTINKPKEGGKGGSKAGDSGEGEDSFTFFISEEEYYDILFEDCGLPKLVKKRLVEALEHAFRRAGYTTMGSPMSRHISHTVRRKMAREIATGEGVSSEELSELEAEFNRESCVRGDEDPVLIDLRERIEVLRRRVGSGFDEHDLRYRNRIIVPKPAVKAVMFCIMDVSGSMDEERKDIAKRFFILLNLFLRRVYGKENVRVEFIRHHTKAERCDQHDFFNKRETGGTVVSSALELTHDVIVEEYPSSDWNVYLAQASDGDNWDTDNEICADILSNKLLPLVQHLAYIQVVGEAQSLWTAYDAVRSALDDKSQMGMEFVQMASDIYSVFRELFKKEGVE
jgi:uncharacterized sporulation protein YeaH/YhbH (DUF444 family)